MGLALLSSSQETLGKGPPATAHKPLLTFPELEEPQARCGGCVGCLSSVSSRTHVSTPRSRGLLPNEIGQPPSPSVLCRAKSQPGVSGSVCVGG